MTSKPQITLWSHGLNPWKVALIMEELNITYQTTFVATPSEKPAEFLAQFPNGRFPAIIDHGNNDFKMFESNAIIEYLLEKYQGDSKVAINSFEERQEARQWLSFQGSGQGVVFQDAAFYTFSAGEKGAFGKERSLREMDRIVSVLDAVLKKTPGGLVGQRLTYVDLVWFWWNEAALTLIAPGLQLDAKYPAFYGWHQRLRQLPSVQRSIEQRRNAPQ